MSDLSGAPPPDRGEVAKMQRLFPKLIEARVVLATERHRHLAEVTLQAKRATLHVEGAAPDFHTAVDQALAALSAQIRRKKERVTAEAAAARTRPARRPGPARSRSRPTRRRRSPVVIRRTSAKPMSLEEAVDQLRLQTDGLLVFTERADGRRQRPAATRRRDGGACRARRLGPPHAEPEPATGSASSSSPACPGPGRARRSSASRTWATSAWTTCRPR